VWSAARRDVSAKVFVDLRRRQPGVAVLEGARIGGRSFRLLGIEPVTRCRRTHAPRRDAAICVFVTPPGQMLVAPEALSDLNLTRATNRPVAHVPPLRATAARARRARGRPRHRAKF
jgi:putative ABC transport system permease protein